MREPLTRERMAVVNGRINAVFHGLSHAQKILKKKLVPWEIHANFEGHVKISVTFFVLVISRDRKIDTLCSWYHWKAGNASYNFHIYTLWSIPYRFWEKFESLTYIRFFEFEPWQRWMILTLLQKFLTKTIIVNLLARVTSFLMV